MHGHSPSDQLAITGPLPKPGQVRFFVEEIAALLGIRTGIVKKWAASRSILHPGWAAGRNGRGQRRVFWLTERGMVQCLAHFRALQGEMWLNKWSKQRRPGRKRKSSVQQGA